MIEGFRVSYKIVCSCVDVHLVIGHVLLLQNTHADISKENIRLEHVCLMHDRYCFYVAQGARERRKPFHISSSNHSLRDGSVFRELFDAGVQPLEVLSYYSKVQFVRG